MQHPAGLSWNKPDFLELAGCLQNNFGGLKKYATSAYSLPDLPV
jgi:hypothetical protein